YYSLAGVFLNTVYHEYPRVPKKVLDNYTLVEEQIQQKQKMLGAMQNNLGTQLAESLAFKTSNYLQGVYEVVVQKREKDTVVENRKLDYELLDRWIAYMEKPTDKYKFKEPWQAMIKRATAAPGAGRGGRGGRGGGMGAPDTKPEDPATTPKTEAAPETKAKTETADANPAAPEAKPAGAEAKPAGTPGGIVGALASAAAEGMPGMGGRGGRGGGRGGANPEVKKLADEFQENVVKVLLARKELNEENEIITAKSLEG